MKSITCVCDKCGATYVKQRARGYLDRCKPCSNRVRVRAWKKAHPERKRELNRRWAEANPDKIRARDTAYAEKNRARLNANALRRRHADPDRAREEWRRGNAQKSARLAPMRAAKRAAKLANRSRQAIVVARSKARRLGLPIPELPPKAAVIYRGACLQCGVEVIRKKSDGRTDRCNRCRNRALNRIERVARRDREAKSIPAWCDRAAVDAFYQIAKRASRCTGIPFHVDHVIPLRGRAVSGLHIPENLQVISKAENLRKNRSFAEAA